MHDGVDFSKPEGAFGKTVYASVVGEVVVVGYNNVRGNYVVIQSGDIFVISQHLNSTEVSVAKDGLSMTSQGISHNPWIFLP